MEGELHGRSDCHQLVFLLPLLLLLLHVIELVFVHHGRQGMKGETSRAGRVEKSAL